MLFLSCSVIVALGSGCQPLTHSTKFPSRRASMIETKKGRKPLISQLDGELFVFPILSSFHKVPLKEGVYGWDEERKKASHFPAWWWTIHFHYSFSLFLYLNLLLGVVSVPKEILISKSGVVKTLWIRSDKRKLHTCSSKEKKIGELS